MQFRLANMMNKSLVIFSFFSFLCLFANVSQAQIKAFSNATEIKWESLTDALEIAFKNEKMIMLVFHGLECPFSKKMKTEVYSMPESIQLIQKYFIPVELNLDAPEKFIYKGNVMNTTQLASIFKVEGSPTITFLSYEGDLIAFQPGYLNPSLFAQLIEYVGTGSYATVSFLEFTNTPKKQ